MSEQLYTEVLYDESGAVCSWGEYIKKLESQNKQLREDLEKCMSANQDIAIENDSLRTDLDWAATLVQTFAEHEPGGSNTHNENIQSMITKAKEIREKHKLGEV